MTKKAKSFWLLLALVLIIYAPATHAQPELCDGGTIYANPFDTTSFHLSGQACVTIVWYYTTCAGTEQPPCCITNTCENNIGYGTIPTQTEQIDTWSSCAVRSDSRTYCLDAGTWYFKGIVSSAYNCPGTYVRITADCSPPNCCP